MTVPSGDLSVTQTLRRAKMVHERLEDLAAPVDEALPSDL